MKYKYPNPFAFGTQMYILFEHIAADSSYEIISFQPIHIHEANAQLSELFTANGKILYFCENLFLDSISTSNQIEVLPEDENGNLLSYLNDPVFNFITLRYTQSMNIQNFIMNYFDTMDNVKYYSFNGYIMTLK